MAPGTVSAMTLKRIQREIIDLQKEDKGDIQLSPVEDNLHIWKGSIPGPEGSVYEGGVFDVDIVLPNDYPFSAPRAMFKTKIYHMNISESGNICIDILKSQWSPALSLFKVMLSLSSLLTDPNPKDPLVPSIASQYKSNRKAHDATARQWTTQYAKPKAAQKAVEPPPPAAAVPAPAVTGRGSRARGRQRVLPETATAGSSMAVASTSHANTANNDVIVLDSDDEDVPANSKGKKRKRGGSAAPQDGSSSGASRPAPEVLDLVEEESRERAKRTRTAPAESTRRTRASARRGNNDEVIIIED